MGDPKQQLSSPAATEPPATSVAATDASALAAQAERLVQGGHFEEALATIERAIAVAPDSLSYWQAKVSILALLNRLAEGLEVLDAALARFGEDRSLLWGKAEFLRVSRDNDGARKAFDRLIAVEPRSADAWLGKGWILLDEGDAEQALSCAERVTMINEGEVYGHVLRGDSLLQLERWTEAFAAYVDAARCDPQQFDASNWAAKGDRFVEADQLDLALKAYERAIMKDPQNPEGWHGKGTVLYRRGDFEEAIAAFERASSVDKQFIAGFLGAGWVCLELRARDRALRFFERAKDARPDDRRPWIYIGEVHASLGRHHEARAAYERATTIDPSDADAWNGLGNTLFQLGQFDEASRSYERAIEVKPDNSWAHHNLSWVRLTQRRFDDATRAINRAIELEPENGAFWAAKLGILADAGALTEAEIDANADRALEAIGSDSELRLSVAHLLADHDRLDRARCLAHEIEPSALEDEESRLSLAECRLKLGENRAAIELLRSIDPNRLRNSIRVVWSFLYLLADRLVGAPRLSDELLVTLLRKLAEGVNQINAISHDWRYKGVRRLLARSELPVSDKLTLATLIDVQEAKVRYDNLSFFTEIWRDSRTAASQVP